MLHSRSIENGLAQMRDTSIPRRMVHLLRPERPGRPHSFVGFTTVLLVAVAILAGGCSSTNGSAKRELREIEALSASDPSAALARLETFAARHPNNLGGLRALALVQEQVGALEDALATWGRVLKQAKSAGLNAAAQDEAHRASGRIVVALLGSPPHRVGGLSESENSSWIAQGEAAFDNQLQRTPRDPAALYGRALLQYHSGAFAASARLLKTLLEQVPGHAAGRYLARLTEEHLAGVTPRLIRELTEWVPTAPADIRRELVLHLLDIASRQALDDRSRFEVSRSLAQLEEDEGLPAEIRNEIVALRSERERQIDTQRAAELASAAQRAAHRGDRPRAWILLTEAVGLDPSHSEARREFASTWIVELLDALQVAIEEENATEARNLFASVEQIPSTDLPQEIAPRLNTLKDRYRSLSEQVGLDAQFQSVQRLLAAGKAEAAAKLLEELESQVVPNGRADFDALYARALHGWGRNDEALEILDELHASGALASFRDNIVYRVYGLLLANAGRGEMARTILEDLPLNLFNADAFEALVHALEQQGEWESILARLETLTFVPQSFRPSLQKAAAEAARRRIRTGDPDAALLLLESYLTPPDFQATVVQEVYLLVLIDLGDFDRASDMILTANPEILGSIPASMLSEVKKRALRELTGFAQFRLFEKLLEIQPDSEIKSWTERLWPQYGSYLPAPGQYLATYEDQELTPAGKVKRAQQFSYELDWKNDAFVVTPKGHTEEPAEEWREVEGVWLRISPEREQRLPVRIEGDPPYSVVQFRSQDELWSAQIVSSGTTVDVGDETYRGCLEIRLVNEENQSQTQLFVIAPRVGLIQWTELKLDTVERRRELITLTPR